MYWRQYGAGMENSDTTLKDKNSVHIFSFVVIVWRELTVMIYCLMVSNGESAGNVFVTELPSGRRNWRRAEVLEQSKRYIHVLFKSLCYFD